MLATRKFIATLLWSSATTAQQERAQGILDSVGGFHALCRIISDPTLSIPGVSRSGMRRLRAAYQLGLEATEVVACRPDTISSSDDVAALIGPRIRHLTHEEVWLVALNARNDVVGIHMVARGGRHGCALLARDVLKVALQLGADAFVLTHNHPGGDPRPSREDVTMTKALREAAETVGTPLVDHVIITRNGHVSMLNLGMIVSSSERKLLAAEEER